MSTFKSHVLAILGGSAMNLCTLRRELERIEWCVEEDEHLLGQLEEMQSDGLVRNVAGLWELH